MTDSRQPKPSRPRNAAATRAAILEAARGHFARRGYDQVGVRDVAATAGVNLALVVRYFGSKEGLFTEAVAADFSVAGLLEGDRAALGERLARAVLHKDAEGGELGALVALLRSAPAEPAATLLRQGIDEGFVRPLAGWLGGEDAWERAGLIAAFLMGLAVTRFVVGSRALAGPELERLVAHAAASLQRSIDGEPEG